MFSSEEEVNKDREPDKGCEEAVEEDVGGDCYESVVENFLPRVLIGEVYNAERDNNRYDPEKEVRVVEVNPTEV